MNLPEFTSVLGRTPGVLTCLLSGLPAEWIHRDDGPGTWSAYDIVGHLLHGEATDWLPRTRMILQHGAERAFQSFDREAMLREQPQPVSMVLARFQAARSESLDQLARLELSAADLDRRGLHPELGEVTLGELLTTWATHDLVHVAQIAEAVARGHRDGVGPWRAYLPALDRVAPAE